MGSTPTVAFVTAFLSTLSLLLAVQTTDAVVTGTVRGGPRAEPLAGATVTLVDLNRSTVTDAAGRYVLRPVPAGPQHLTIRFIGHTLRTIHALVPSAGTLEIDVILRPTPVRLAAVEVRPNVAVRGVEIDEGTAYPDRGITMAAVRQHPALAEPDAFQALAGGHVMLAPEAPSGVHIRGGGSDQTAYLLDAIPVFSPYHAAGVFSAWNPDALDRLELISVSPSPSYPDALSGVIEATTREPGDRLSAHGAMSSSQARATVDGPLGIGRAGYLLSIRSGLPGPINGSHDPSYLHGETGDWLAKVVIPALGGQLRVLGYGSANELSVAAQTDGERSQALAVPRNVFDWYSRSIGVEWRRTFSAAVVRVVGWRAGSDQGAIWAASPATSELAARRRDAGASAIVEHRTTGRATTAGVRIERSRTSYEVVSDSTLWALSGLTPLATAFVQHTASVGKHAVVEMGTSLAVTSSHQRVSPRVRVAWNATDRLAFSASYARLHQFSQSLRNSESVVSTIFPADIYVGAGVPGVPIARSDQGVLSADWRPFPGARLGAQMYVRDFAGLITSALRDAAPFAIGALEVGEGTARGLSVDASLSTARTGFVASYGVQRVRLDDRIGQFVPGYGPRQMLDAGFIVYPSATWSIRLGAASLLGRPSTMVANGIDFESCNLLDAGCEFSGTPQGDARTLGKTSLPSYVRLDLGVRKHWHISVRERELLIGAFGTVTNVFNHRNVLTYARSTPSGAPFGIVMRPVAPLVVGLDWQF